MNEESAEILPEITETDLQDVEFLDATDSVYEAVATEAIDGTELVDDTEFLEDTEAPEAVEDVDTELVEGEVLTDSSNVVDYTEQIDHVVVCLDIIVMILLTWFGSWVLRSWRTWTVKGGK